MKRSVTQAALVMVVGALTIATGAIAQLASDSAAKARAPIAHLTVAPRSIAFGKVKASVMRAIRVKNTGTMDANVTVVGPPSPFSITSGGGSYPLTPGQEQDVEVQFAPTAAGPVRQVMTIQCANCNTAADDIILIHLSGNANAPVASPSASPTGAPTSSPSPGTTANALPFSVTAGAFDNADQPLASITVCATGTSNCNTINNVIVDTGSSGLRVFGSQLTGLGISPNTNLGHEIGECAFFGSGSTWGAISTVDVQIGGEPTITIPIQVIDDINAFPAAPRDCTNGSVLESSPNVAGFNALLGLGQVSTDLPNIYTEYFNCSGGDCSTLDNPANTDIVVNPVSAFPVDNNGVVVSLPAISAGGQQTTNGTLYFGIGTESDNQPGAVTTYLEDSNINDANYLDIDTVFKGKTAGGFFDTGSNGYFFNDSSIKQCSDGSGFYCPASTLSESATIKSVGGSSSGVVSFAISNADTLFNTNGAAFDDLGGSYDGGTSFDGFDWGLPFFFGRTVYISIEGTSSPLGNGPSIAY